MFYNYIIEVSNDNETWTTAYDYRDVSAEYIDKTTNRTTVSVFSPDDQAQTLYIRLSNTDPTKEYGAGIRTLTVKYQQSPSQS